MCGIGGIAAVDGTTLPEQTDQTLHDMARALAHRGPDAERLLRDGPVALVFQRLSLVDPVGGGQPLSTHDETLFLIANGEVYMAPDAENKIENWGVYFVGNRGSLQVNRQGYAIRPVVPHVIRKQGPPPPDKIWVILILLIFLGIVFR